jgi:hypothetical protein
MEVKQVEVIFQIIQVRKCTIEYIGNIQDVILKEKINIEKSQLLEQTDPEIITTIRPE